MTTSSIAGHLACKFKALMKTAIVLITLVNLIWTRRKIKFGQLLLNLDHGNQEQPFTEPDQKTIKGSSFNFSLDLTKRCYDLLIKAKGLITYDFSDVNCPLVLKFNDNSIVISIVSLNLITY